ncbi:hypothetical protein [Flectobacillus major]|jgi:nucleoside-diphosphate-sugar epimerase|uniref:hypothetical protein n=1 Tax=Flectobacillus major TaxID=103 RepID=UPI00041E396E|nr:hypothetical protein [Flectobacillus major]
MKVSILGCGWLGFPLGQFLLTKGFEVKGSVTSEAKTQRLLEAGIIPAVIQLSPSADAQLLANFCDADVLVIAIPPKAGKLGVNHHVEQIEHIIPVIKQSPLKAVIYISSTSVYLDDNDTVTEESSTIEQNTMVKTELILKKELTAQGLTILRYGGLMGSERIPAKYFAGRTISTADVPVNYIHQDDAVGVVAWIIEHGFWNETFNAVSPIHPIRKDIYLKNCEDLGYDKPTFTEPMAPVPFKIVDVQKLIDKTGYQFKYANPLDYTYTKPVV